MSDLVWDRYIKDSLKGTARAKRGKGVCRRVVAETVIPGNWQDFLHMNSNKTELFKFLSDALFKSYNQKKQLVITDGESVLSKPPLCDLASNSLSPCSHEEADTRMHTIQHTMVITRY